MKKKQTKITNKQTKKKNEAFVMNKHVFFNVFMLRNKTSGKRDA